MPATTVVSNATTSLDGTALAAASSSKYKPTAVNEGETPYQFDLGLLTSINPNPLDVKAYRASTADYLSSLARDGVQALVNKVFALPITRDAEYGPLAALPAFTSKLPREKSLPKPKPLTKWEKFAKQKGIQSKKKDKLIYDEETQTWVPRWGYKGANKDFEDQWIHEIKNNGENDLDPGKTAKKERLAKIKKNESQRIRNVARAAGETSSSSSAGVLASKGAALADANAAKLARAAHRERRKAELEADILRNRASTASLGRFDNSLPGESKPKGIKRKFDPTEQNTSHERSANLALLDKLGTAAMRKKAITARGQGDAEIVNTRKAVQFATAGHGVTSMRSKPSTGKKGRK
ncbi:RRS1-domain-containing protein [Testicularia cyperi]|uniref:Ribosome biogenesis regulatory protein n=1 Tax=Testicularia cyperi TaxID=1882483 RepID=A0A317XG53_9BASI|nr:RRS1-domain-containing protein [Testicularia cyperi]